MKVKHLVVFLLLLMGCAGSQKIVVTDLQVYDGNPSEFKFDLKHTFDTKRYCYSNVSLFENNVKIAQNITYLGEYEPEKQQEEFIIINFPGEKTDYQLDINCFEEKI
ncbi:MAG: hypothetical protein MAG795_00491 [Candidatus Woesearchaeota archaeon]|nr:hypothetical protein [Candidatus Woesearchaeota archaeon]